MKENIFNRYFHHKIKDYKPQQSQYKPFFNCLNITEIRKNKLKMVKLFKMADSIHHIGDEVFHSLASPLWRCDKVVFFSTPQTMQSWKLPRLIW